MPHMWPSESLPPSISGPSRCRCETEDGFAMLELSTIATGSP